MKKRREGRKMIGGVFAVILTVVTSFSLAGNVSAGGGEIVDITGEDLPVDLSLDVENITNDTNNAVNFLQFYFGDSETASGYIAGEKMIREKGIECYTDQSLSDEEREGCLEEQSNASMEFFKKYKFMFFSLEDIHLVSNGDAYEYEGGNIDLDVYVTDYDDLLESIEDNIAEGGYDVDVEPIVVHKKHDGKYELVNAEYDLETNSLRFTVSELSTFMIGYRFVWDDEDESEPSPATLDDAQKSASVAIISAIGLFTLGAWMVKKEGR